MFDYKKNVRLYAIVATDAAGLHTLVADDAWIQVDNNYEAVQQKLFMSPGSALLHFRNLVTFKGVRPDWKYYLQLLEASIIPLTTNEITIDINVEMKRPV